MILLLKGNKLKRNASQLSELYELKDLILLTKGTERSCAKFNGKDYKNRKSKKKSDIKIWPTNNGNG